MPNPSLDPVGQFGDELQIPNQVPQIPAAQAPDMLAVLRQLERRGMFTPQIQQVAQQSQFAAQGFAADQRLLQAPGALYQTGQLDLSQQDLDWAKMLAQYQTHTIDQTERDARYIPREHTEPGGFLRVLEWLSASLYATAGSARALVRLAKGEETETNPFVEFYNGLTLRDPETWQNVFEELGWDGQDGYSHTSRKFLGFVADLILDPINLVTFGSAQAGRFVLAAGKKIPLKAGKVLAAGQKIESTEYIRRVVAGVVAHADSGGQVTKRTEALMAGAREEAARLGSQVELLHAPTGITKDSILMEQAIASDVELTLGKLLIKNDDHLEFSFRRHGASPERFFELAFDDPFAADVMREILKVEGKVAADGSFALKDAFDWIKNDGAKLIDPGGISILRPFSGGQRYTILKSRSLDKFAFKSEQLLMNSMAKIGGLYKTAFGEEAFTRAAEFVSRQVERVAITKEKIGSLFGVEAKKSVYLERLVQEHVQESRRALHDSQVMGLEAVKDPRTSQALSPEVQSVIYDTVQRESAAADKFRRELGPVQRQQIKDGTASFTDLYEEKHLPNLHGRLRSLGHSEETAEQIVERTRENLVLMNENADNLQRAGLLNAAKDYYLPLQYVNLEFVRKRHFTKPSADQGKSLTDQDPFARLRELTPEVAEKEFGLKVNRDLKEIIAGRLYSARLAFLRRDFMQKIIQKFGITQEQADNVLGLAFGPRGELGTQILQALRTSNPSRNLFREAAHRYDPRIADFEGMIHTGDLDGALEFLESNKSLISRAYLYDVANPDEEAVNLIGQLHEIFKSAKATNIEFLTEVRNELHMSVAALAPQFESLIDTSVVDELGRLVSRSGVEDVAAGELRMAAGMAQLVEDRVRTTLKIADEFDGDLLRISHKKAFHEMGPEGGGHAMRLAVLNQLMSDEKLSGDALKMIESQLGRQADDIAHEVVRIIQESRHEGSFRYKGYDENLAIVMARTYFADQMERHVSGGVRVPVTTLGNEALQKHVNKIAGLQAAGEKVDDELASFFQRFGQDPTLVGTWQMFRARQGLRSDMPLGPDFFPEVFELIADGTKAKQLLGTTDGFFSQPIMRDFTKQGSKKQVRLEAALGTLAKGDPELWAEYRQMIYDGAGSRAGFHYNVGEGISSAMMGVYNTRANQVITRARELARENAPREVLKAVRATRRERELIAPVLQVPSDFPKNLQGRLAKATGEMRRALEDMADLAVVDKERVSLALEEFVSRSSRTSTTPGTRFTERFEELDEATAGLVGTLEDIYGTLPQADVARQMLKSFSDNLQSRQLELSKLREEIEVASEPFYKALRNLDGLVGDATDEQLAAMDAVREAFDKQTEAVESMVFENLHRMPEMPTNDLEAVMFQEDPLIGGLHELRSALRRELRDIAPDLAADFKRERIAISRALEKEADATRDKLQQELAQNYEEFDQLADRFRVHDQVARMAFAGGRGQLQRLTGEIADSAVLTAGQQSEAVRGYFGVVLGEEFLTRYPAGGSMAQFHETVDNVLAHGIDDPLWTEISNALPNDEFRAMVREFVESHAPFGDNVRSVDEYHALFGFQPTRDWQGVTGVQEAFRSAMPEELGQALGQSFFQKVQDRASKATPTNVERVLSDVADAALLRPQAAREVFDAMREESNYIRAFVEEARELRGSLSSLGVDAHGLIVKVQGSLISKQPNTAIDATQSAFNQATDLLDKAMGGDGMARASLAELGLSTRDLELIDSGGVMGQAIDRFVDDAMGKVNDAYRQLTKGVFPEKARRADPEKVAQVLQRVNFEDYRGFDAPSVTLEADSPVQQLQELLGNISPVSGDAIADRARYWMWQMGMVDEAARGRWGALNVTPDVIKRIGEGISERSSRFFKSSSGTIQALKAEGGRIAGRTDDTVALARLTDAEARRMRTLRQQFEAASTERTVTFGPGNQAQSRSTEHLRRYLRHLSFRNEYEMLEDIRSKFPTRDETNIMRSRALRRTASEGLEANPTGPVFDVHPDTGQVIHRGAMMDEPTAAKFESMSSATWDAAQEQLDVVLAGPGRVIHRATGVQLSSVPSETQLAQALIRKNVAGVMVDEKGKSFFDFEAMREGHGRGFTEAVTDAVGFFRFAKDGISLTHLPATDAQIGAITSLLDTVTHGMRGGDAQALQSALLYSVTSAHRADRLKAAEAAAAIEYLEQKVTLALSNTGRPLKEGFPRDPVKLRLAAEAARIVAPDIDRAAKGTRQARALLDTEEDLVRLPFNEFDTLVDAKGDKMDLFNNPVYVPRHVLDIINREVLGTPGEDRLRGVVRQFAKFTNIFKEAVTWPFPSFHVRNAVDSSYRAYLAIGAKAFNPERNRQMWKLVHTQGAGAIELSLPNGALVKYSYDAIRETMEKNKIVSTFGEHVGFQELDFDNLDLFNPAAGSQYTFAQLGASIAKGNIREAGRTVRGKVTSMAQDVDNTFRASLFVSGLERGMPPQEAARWTQKFMFDYNSLTGFEKNAMRLIVPFYTFSRFNIPLSLETLFKRPGLVSGIGKTRGFLSNLDDNEDLEKLVPNHVKEKWNFFPTVEGGELKVWSASNLLSVEELKFLSNLEFWRGDDLTDAFFEELMGRINPMLKVPFELALDRNLYFNKAVFQDHRVEESIVKWPVLSQWLDSREVRVGDKTYWRVNGDRYLALTQLHTGRLYNVIKNTFSDDDMSAWERWAPFITSARLHNINLERRWEHMNMVSKFHHAAIKKAILEGDHVRAERLMSDATREEHEASRIVAAMQALSQAKSTAP